MILQFRFMHKMLSKYLMYQAKQIKIWMWSTTTLEELSRWKIITYNCLYQLLQRLNLNLHQDLRQILLRNQHQLRSHNLNLLQILLH